MIIHHIIRIVKRYSPFSPQWAVTSHEGIFFACAPGAGEKCWIIEKSHGTEFIVCFPPAQDSSGKVPAEGQPLSAGEEQGDNTDVTNIEITGSQNKSIDISDKEKYNNDKIVMTDVDETKNIPEDIRMGILAGVDGGYLADILSHLEELEKVNSPLAVRLRQMTEDFEYEKIKLFLGGIRFGC